MIIKNKDINKLHKEVIDELLVNSLGECLYTLRAYINGKFYNLHLNGKPYKAFSIGQIYQDTEKLNIKRVTLIQNSPYDEMIGQPVKEAPNTLVISSEVKPDIFSGSTH